MKTLRLDHAAARKALAIGLLLVFAAIGSAASTSTVSATVLAPTQVPAAPARSTDGSYYITEPGVYSGHHFDCPGLSAAQFCVKIWTEGGVHLDNFWITTS